MKALSYLLIFLLLSTQVDGLWALVPLQPLQTAPDTDDNELLPTPRRQAPSRSSLRQKPVRPGLTSATRDAISSGSRKGPPEAPSAGSFGPAPLYVFMSMQC
jgi:hypothetical protein